MAERSGSSFQKARSAYEKSSDSLPRKPTRQLGNFLDAKKSSSNINSPNPSGAKSVVSKMFSRKKKEADQEDDVIAENPEYLNKLDAMLQNSRTRHEQQAQQTDSRTQSRMRSKTGSLPDDRQPSKNDSPCIPPSRVLSTNQVSAPSRTESTKDSVSSSKPNGSKSPAIVSSSSAAPPTSSSQRTDSSKISAPKTPTKHGKSRSSRSHDSISASPSPRSPRRRAVSSPRIRSKSRHRSKSRRRAANETSQRKVTDDEGSSSSSEIKTPTSRKSNSSRSRSRRRKARSSESKMGDSVADFGKLSKRSHRHKQDSIKPRRTRSPVIRKNDAVPKPVAQATDSSSLKTHHLRRLVSNSEDISSIMSQQSSTEGIISLRAIQVSAMEQDRAPTSPPRRGSLGGIQMLRPPRRRSSAGDVAVVVLEENDEDSASQAVEGGSDRLPMKDLFSHYRWSSAEDSKVDSDVREKLRQDFLLGRAL